MPDERLPELLARLDRERLEADRRYNDALTTLDRSLPRAPSLPDPPPDYDDTKLTAVNLAWNILPDGPPPVDRSIRGRLRGLVWRLVGPPLEMQRQFNAALVDHLNRNVAAHQGTSEAVATLVDGLRQHLDGLLRFRVHLLQYLQLITLYVDTKDRGVLGQAQVINASLGSMADDWLRRWESLAAHDQRLLARLASRDGSLDDLRATTAMAHQAALTVKRELERLRDAWPADGGAAPGPAPPLDLDSYKYVGFQDAFRGPREEIQARLAEYVPRFQGLTDVLDLGCGRGEFLDLLREQGIPARGLDINHDMVEASRARGHDVAAADALSYLRELPDEALGGVFSAQVVEHLEPAYLLALLETLALKVRPAGVVVLETINPACWVAFFESYIRDITHVRPLHPETLQYLVRASGFHQVEVEFCAPVSADKRLHVAPPASKDTPLWLADLVDTFNENVAKLNSRLFTHQDYAVVARR